MKSLLVISLLVLGAWASTVHHHVSTSVQSTAVVHKIEPPVAYCYSEVGLGGRCIKLTASMSHLCTCNFNNMIKSVHLTGFWMFYEHDDYNRFVGKIYYAFGNNIAFDLPPSYSNVISSVRLIEGQLMVAQNFIYFFEGPHCTLQWRKWSTHVESFSAVPIRFSSILTLGKSPWTLYSEAGFQGQHICIYPNVKYNMHYQKQTSSSYHYQSSVTHSDIGYGSTAGYHVGIYSNITTLGIQNFQINSMKVGCFSKTKTQSNAVVMSNGDDTGGWGSLV